MWAIHKWLNNNLIDSMACNFSSEGFFNKVDVNICQSCENIWLNALLRSGTLQKMLQASGRRLLSIFFCLRVKHAVAKPANVLNDLCVPCESIDSSREQDVF